MVELRQATELALESILPLRLRVAHDLEGNVPSQTMVNGFVDDAEAARAEPAHGLVSLGSGEAAGHAEERRARRFVPEALESGFVRETAARRLPHSYGRQSTSLNALAGRLRRAARPAPR
jgi:hypothetical protein